MPNTNAALWILRDRTPENVAIATLLDNTGQYVAWQHPDGRLALEPDHALEAETQGVDPIRDCEHRALGFFRVSSADPGFPSTGQRTYRTLETLGQMGALPPAWAIDASATSGSPDVPVGVGQGDLHLTRLADTEPDSRSPYDCVLVASCTDLSGAITNYHIPNYYLFNMAAEYDLHAASMGEIIGVDARAFQYHRESLLQQTLRSTSTYETHKAVESRMYDLRHMPDVKGMPGVIDARDAHADWALREAAARGGRPVLMHDPATETPVGQQPDGNLMLASSRKQRPPHPQKWAENNALAYYLDNDGTMRASVLSRAAIWQPVTDKWAPVIDDYVRGRPQDTLESTEGRLGTLYRWRTETTDDPSSTVSLPFYGRANADDQLDMHRDNESRLRNTPWFVLGADSPEMHAIECLLKECEVPYEYAQCRGQRVEPHTSQDADGISGMADLSARDVIAVDCGWPYATDPMPLASTHLMPRFLVSESCRSPLENSSLGQVIGVLAEQGRLPAAWRNTDTLTDISDTSLLTPGRFLVPREPAWTAGTASGADYSKSDVGYFVSGRCDRESEHVDLFRIPPAYVVGSLAAYSLSAVYGNDSASFDDTTGVATALDYDTDDLLALRHDALAAYFYPDAYARSVLAANDMTSRFFADVSQRLAGAPYLEGLPGVKDLRADAPRDPADSAAFCAMAAEVAAQSDAPAVIPRFTRDGGMSLTFANRQSISQWQIVEWASAHGAGSPVIVDGSAMQMYAHVPPERVDVRVTSWSYDPVGDVPVYSCERPTGRVYRYADPARPLDSCPEFSTPDEAVAFAGGAVAVATSGASPQPRA